jgi:type I restriction enzyme M protein
MSSLTEVLFIERCLNLLKPGGRMGIVLPEGVLNNTNLQKIRDFVESRAKIILITSIPQDVFIASGATVKPSLLFFKKFTEEEAKQWKNVTTKASTTGAQIENELKPLAEEFLEYRKNNKLWDKKFDYINYEVDEEENFYRIPFAGNPSIAQEPEMFYGK